MLIDLMTSDDQRQERKDTSSCPSPLGQYPAHDKMVASASPFTARKQISM
eukprot:m.60125 g.60125  ORF g.60125 m.60125 type:complete len:50 (+) comp13836_c0_seq5:1714-1863(+)